MKTIVKNPRKNKTKQNKRKEKKSRIRNGDATWMASLQAKSFPLQLTIQINYGAMSSLNGKTRQNSAIDKTELFKSK